MKDKTVYVVSFISSSIKGIEAITIVTKLGTS
jgi:hypothetical protein